MARGRMLSTTIAGDQRLNSLSIEAEYLFLKTIPHLDRDGLIYGKANLLWAKACPERMELLPRIDGLVTEWVQKSLVMKYDTADGPVLYFYGFRKNQTGIRYDRESASIFAPPPGYIRKDGKDGGLFTVDELATAAPVRSDDEPDTDSGQSNAEPTTEQLRSNSGVTPDEIPLKAKESKVNQSKLNEGERETPPPASAYVPPMSHHKLQAALTALNARMEPALRVKYVKPVESYLGLSALVESGDDEALLKVHNAAIDIYEMGVTLQNLRSWWSDWKKDFRSKGPSVKQFKEFCSEKLGETSAQAVMQPQPLHAMGKVIDYPFSL